MSGTEYHKRGGEQMRNDAERVAAIEAQLEAAFERWAELEATAERGTLIPRRG